MGDDLCLVGGVHSACVGRGGGWGDSASYGFHRRRRMWWMWGEEMVDHGWRSAGWIWLRIRNCHQTIEMISKNKMNVEKGELSGGQI